MRIWKYTLIVVDRQTLFLPEGARILTVQMQDYAPQLWAIVDESEPSEPREIAIYGTGNPMPDEPGIYIGTFQMHDGALVWHVFEVPR